MSPTPPPKSSSVNASKFADQCREYLAEKIFRLRPARYDERFGLWPGEVGLEMESWPVRPGEPRAGIPGRVMLHGDDSLAAALMPMVDREGWRAEFADPLKKLMKIAIPNQTALPDWITFEPGGQIEISSAPFPCLSEAVERMHLIDDLSLIHI